MHAKWKCFLSFRRKEQKWSQEKLLTGNQILQYSFLKIKRNSERREPYPCKLHQYYHARSLLVFSFLFSLSSFELGTLTGPLDSKFTYSAPALYLTVAVTQQELGNNCSGSQSIDIRITPSGPLTRHDSYES